MLLSKKNVEGHSGKTLLSTVSQTVGWPSVTWPLNKSWMKISRTIHGPWQNSQNVCIIEWVRNVEKHHLRVEAEETVSVLDSELSMDEIRCRDPPQDQYDKIGNWEHEEKTLCSLVGTVSPVKIHRDRTWSSYSQPWKRLINSLDSWKVGLPL